MRLRSLNTTRASQLDEHGIRLANAFDRHERDYADRHGDDPIQRLYARLHAMKPDTPVVPKRTTVGSRQHVRIFRPVTMADVIPPDVCGFDPTEIVDEAAEKTLVHSDCYRHIDFVSGGGGHAALVGFQNASQETATFEYERKLAKRALKLKRRAERFGPKSEQDLVPVDEDESARRRQEAAKWSDVCRSRKQAVRDLYKNGFFWNGGSVAGDIYEAFSEFFGEDCLRSHLGSPSLARWAQIIPRAHRMRVGTDKEALLSTDSKALGLLAPYVETDRKRACAIVVELDSVWKSAGQLRAKLLEILPPHMMPSLIVGRYSRDFLFCRPHLIWLLKPGSEVWTDLFTEWTDDDGVVHHLGDKRCKKRPLNFFRAIQRGLTALLLPIGADPACHNIWKPKNPLSPFWTTVVANDDYWPVLKDFLAIPGFRLEVDEHALAEKAAAMRAEAVGGTPSASNAAWRAVGNVLEPLVRQAFAGGDPSFMEAGKSIDMLTAWLDQRVRPVVEAELGCSDALDRVLTGRCAFAARYCRRKAGKRRKLNRGRDRDAFFDVSDTKARRAIAGQRSAKHRRAVSLHNIRKEMLVLLRSTGSIRKADFIKNVSTVSKTVAYTIFDEAIAMLAVEFRDGAYRYIGRSISGKTNNPSSGPAAIQPLASTDSNRLSTGILNVRVPIQPITSSKAGGLMGNRQRRFKGMLGRLIGFWGG